MTTSKISFDPKMLEQLADLIDCMLCTSREQPPEIKSTSRYLNTLQLVVFFALIPMALTIVVLAFAQVRMNPAPEWVPEVASGIALAMVVVLLLYVVYTTWVLGKLLWQHRKHSDQPIFFHTRSDLKSDAEHIEKLVLFPRSVLEYALLQYQHHGNELTKRTTLLAGDIAKIGLFPGILALFISAQKLAESQTNLWFWMLLILAGIFYIFAFTVLASNNRRTQVLLLLQYAINHAPLATNEASQAPE